MTKTQVKSNIVAFGLFVVKFNHAQIIILVFLQYTLNM